MLTSEVLPSIRRHGAYLTPAKVEEVSANPDAMRELIAAFAAQSGELAMLREKERVYGVRIPFGAPSKASGLPRTLPRRATLTAPPRQAIIYDGGLFVRQDEEGGD